MAHFYKKKNAFGFRGVWCLIIDSIQMQTTADSTVDAEIDNFLFFQKTQLSATAAHAASLNVPLYLMERMTI